LEKGSPTTRNLPFELCPPVFLPFPSSTVRASH